MSKCVTDEEPIPVESESGFDTFVDLCLENQEDEQDASADDEHDDAPGISTSFLCNFQNLRMKSQIPSKPPEKD